MLGGSGSEGVMNPSRWSDGSADESKVGAMTSWSLELVMTSGGSALGSGRQSMTSVVEGSMVTSWLLTSFVELGVSKFSTMGGELEGESGAVGTSSALSCAEGSARRELSNGSGSSRSSGKKSNTRSRGSRRYESRPVVTRTVLTLLSWMNTSLILARGQLNLCDAVLSRTMSPIWGVHGVRLPARLFRC